jgi:hypothetical protein
MAMDRAERQLWEGLQESIGAAEQADRQLMAVSTVPVSDSTYFQLTCAAERARQARIACDQAFADWKRVSGRHVRQKR